MDATKYEVLDSVAVLSFTNPPAELYTQEFLSDVAKRVEQAKRDEVRAMVIWSDGGLFSGGVDLHEFKGKSQREAAAMLAEGFELINGIEDATFPVIAAVNGQVLAAGLELALACDMIIASDDAVFSQVEALIGATTFLGGAYRIAERCGPARAREIVYTAGRYPAETFERWNIINRVVPLADLRDEAMKLAREFAAGPALAHEMTKRLIKHSSTYGIRAADQYNVENATYLFESADMQKAVNFMLTEGPRRFIQNHDEIIFEGR